MVRPLVSGSRWANFLFRRPYTTQVVAEHFKVIYTVRDGVTWIVAIAHPARRVRYWVRRKLKR
jgi:hypothetical protein